MALAKPSKFASISPFTFKWEGGYVNDKDDPGGRTLAGISEKYNPDLWKDGAPSKEQIEQRYKERYWDAVRGDDLPEGVATVAFDTSVLHGPERSVKFIQRALGVRDTGVFDEQTKAQLDRYVQTHGEEKLIDDLIARRRDYTHALVEQNPKKEKFYRGWMNRIEDLERTAKKKRVSITERVFGPDKPEPKRVFHVPLRPGVFKRRVEPVPVKDVIPKKLPSLYDKETVQLMPYQRNLPTYSSPIVRAMGAKRRFMPKDKNKPSGILRAISRV